MPTWALPLILGVAGTVAGKTAEKLMTRGTAVWIWQTFGVELWPVWFGAGLALIVWAFLSIWRVTHGRDGEFKKWLDRRERDLSDALEAKAARFENYHKAGLEQNKAAAEEFTARYARRLLTLEDSWNALDVRLGALESRIGDQR